MMSPSEFDRYVQGFKVPDEGVAVLKAVRGQVGEPAPPARQPESHVGNGIVRYSSKKMPFVVVCESARVEFVSVLQLEHDPHVLEYYSQPCRITLSYDSANGRPQVVQHTPDALVLRDDGILFRECKTRQGLEKLGERQPHRFVLTDGRWSCPPGQTAAQVYGFTYEVWTPDQLSRNFAANLRYLDPHFKRSPDAYSPDDYGVVIRYVEQNQGISISALTKHLGPSGPGLTLWILAHGHLFCDLDKFELSRPDSALVYTHREVAQAAEQFVKATPPDKKWPVAALSVPNSSAVSTLYTQFGISALRRANRRLALLQGGSPVGDPVSARTLTRWRKSYAVAQQARGVGFLGLVPQTSRQGDHRPRFDPAVYSLADDVIKNLYLITAGMRIAAAYRQFKHRCELACIAPIPSHVWFWGRARAIAPEDVVAARQGPRAHYAISGGPKGRVGVLDVHGDYPFQWVHIDHTQLDVQARSSRSPLCLGRPWLTVAFDSFSRSVVGFYISYDGPSTDAVLMVLRDIVLRREILPLGFTIDNGPEFRSEWFEIFAGVKNITLYRRPPHHPRFGSLMENFFGVANDQLIHNLEGNTKLMRNVRQVTKSLDPAGKAIWTLPALCHLFEEYCFTIFNQHPHAELGQTPQESLESNLFAHGVADSRRQTFDDEFVLSTLVPVPDETARVQCGRGVKVRNDYFYNQALAQHVGKDVRVRYDPMDPGRVFCELKGKWVPCFSKYADVVAGLSVRQVQCWADELRQRHAATAKISDPAVARLARFIEDVKGRREGELRLQYERALDNRDALALRPRLLPPGTPFEATPLHIEPKKVASTPSLADQMFTDGPLPDLPTSQLSPE